MIVINLLEVFSSEFIAGIVNQDKSKGGTAVSKYTLYAAPGLRERVVYGDDDVAKIALVYLAH